MGCPLIGFKGLKVSAIRLFICIIRGIYFGIFLAFTGVNVTLMKRQMRWVPLVLLLLLFSFRTASPAGDTYNLDAVATALRSGNVNQLSPYLDVRVDVSLPDKTDTYSKTQAEMVIRDFFYTHEVRNFRIVQQGENGEYLFCSGLLQTRSGNYRTSLFFKQKAGKQFLQEIRFETME
jgi:hypothetical protein